MTIKDFVEGNLVAELCLLSFEFEQEAQIEDIEAVRSILRRWRRLTSNTGSDFMIRVHHGAAYCLYIAVPEADSRRLMEHLKSWCALLNVPIRFTAHNTDVVMEGTYED